MFLAAYAVLEWVSFIHEHKCVPVTPWNPGLGVVFALMVFVGLWGSFVLFIGVITAEFFVLESKLEWPIVIGVGAITSSSYTFVAAVARHYGVEAFVNMSQMTVTQMSITETTDSPQHKLHWLAEQALSWSGLPVVYHTAYGLPRWVFPALRCPGRAGRRRTGAAMATLLV